MKLLVHQGLPRLLFAEKGQHARAAHADPDPVKVLPAAAAAAGLGLDAPELDAAHPDAKQLARLFESARARVRALRPSERQFAPSELVQLFCEQAAAPSVV